MFPLRRAMIGRFGCRRRGRWDIQVCLRNLYVDHGGVGSGGELRGNIQESFVHKSIITVWHVYFITIKVLICRRTWLDKF